jgi:hypothetical protein
MGDAIITRLKKIAASDTYDEGGSLENELIGWSASDIDNSFDTSGKNVLHHAAWRGAQENVAILLNHGADINSHSVGEFSYGKSPIFFAVTRCRDDITLFLLSRGASCRIVNNKGQSVLSLASTHLHPSTIDIIRMHESSETCEWKNFRLSNSDGRIYGDLDPRFMERNVLPSDLITPYAVNPTTHISRKGNFARNNPGQSSEEKRKLLQQQNVEEARMIKLQQRSVPPPSVTPSDDDLIRLLGELQIAADQSIVGANQEIIAVLCRLFDLYENCKSSWLPGLVGKILHRINSSGDIINYLFGDQMEMMEISDLSSRHKKLLRKLHQSLTGNTSSNQLPQINTGQSSYKKPKLDTLSSILPEPVESLPLLPPPAYRWVDTLHDLDQMKSNLHQCVESLSQPNGTKPYLAIDTEWATIKNESNHSNDTIIATIQVAIRNRDGAILCWVVDALSPSYHSKKAKQTSDSSILDWAAYSSSLNDMLVWMWCSTTPLGFAVSNDVDKLQKMVPSHPLLLVHCFDVQRIASKIIQKERSSHITFVQESMQNAKKPNLPGLKFCVAYFMKNQLCKKEQMSDWKKRPLTNSQLSYAALDAVVLIPLLDILLEKEN